MKKLLILLCFVTLQNALGNPIKGIKYSNPRLDASHMFSIITAQNKENGDEVGTILYSSKHSASPYRVIENIAVEKGFRKQGIGKKLMLKALVHILTEQPEGEIRLTACPAKDSDMNLSQLVGFYKDFGFDLIAPLHENQKSACMSRSPHIFKNV